MRRALLALAIMGMVCSAQALWVNWKAPAGAQDSYASAILVNVADGASFSQESLLSAIKGGSVDGYTSIAWEKDSTILSNKVLGSVSDSISQSGTYYLVLFNEETQSYAYNVNGIIYNTVSENGVPAFQKTEASMPPIPPLGVFDPGEWTTGVVPEPTVLALLALGVAGMALRRRVA